MAVPGKELNKILRIEFPIVTPYPLGTGDNIKLPCSEESVSSIVTSGDGTASFKSSLSEFDKSISVYSNIMYKNS